MAEIFIDLNGVKTPVTKQKLFELAAAGVIEPSTRLWYGDKETVCRKVQGLSFKSAFDETVSSRLSAPVVVQPSADQEVFSLKSEPLPTTPTFQTNSANYDDAHEKKEAEAKKEAEEKEKERKIIFAVTVGSLVMIIVFGYICSWFLLGSKKKPKKKEKAEVTTPAPPVSQPPIPPLPQPATEESGQETAPPTDPSPNPPEAAPAPVTDPAVK